MSFAPLALFVYRRPDHTRRTLESLRACAELAESPLYVFCDGAKTSDAAAAVGETRRVARQLAPSAIFLEREQNLGLAKSIIGGVTQLCDEHGKVIVIEDDLELSPSFLRFMNEGLDRYADDERVMQVSGFQFPLQPPLSSAPRFFSFSTSWGWATWARAWKHFDPQALGYTQLRADAALRRRFDLDAAYPYFDMLERQRMGEVDSWAIRWYLSIFLRDGLVLFPGRSLVKNTGMDGSGTHGDNDAMLSNDIGDAQTWANMPKVELDAEAQARVIGFLAASRTRSWSARVGGLLQSWRRRLH